MLRLHICTPPCLHCEALARAERLACVRPAPALCSSDPHESKRGLFAHPPAPSAFTTTGFELLRDLLSGECPFGRVEGKDERG